MWDGASYFAYYLYTGFPQQSGELAALRRAFRLAKRAKLVERVPDFDMLSERNEPDEFQAILAELPDDVRPIAEVGYVTGWRVGELLSREWRHVDLQGGWLRLEPGETKNGEGRAFPINDDLRAVLKRQVERKRKVEAETGRVVRALFFWSDGKPIKDFRGAWKAATKAAGFPALLFHDLRRSAVCNLERAGVSRSTAMRLTGHKTEAVYRRYAIVAESDLREGSAKLNGTLRARPTQKKVAGHIG